MKQEQVLIDTDMLSAILRQNVIVLTKSEAYWRNTADLLFRLLLAMKFCEE